MLKKYLKWVVLPIPFILGTIGFCIAHERFMDAMFYSFSMYFVGYESVSAPNILVEITRWSAPIILISEVAVVVQKFWNQLRTKKKIISDDAVAVYCTEAKKEQCLGSIDNAIFAGNTVRTDAKHHILMLDSDRENIELASQISSGDVYIELKETDSFLMKSTDRHFFNINEMIARNYWVTYDLVQENVASYKIGIISYGVLGKKMLKFGLMCNIYDLDQHIEYHVYGADDPEYEKMELANNDKICFHTKPDESLFQCDRIIFTGAVDVQLLEKILYRSRAIRVYYYAAEPYLEKIYDGAQIQCYGYDVCSRANIMTDRLYEKAMIMNYNYLCLYDSAHYKQDDPNRATIMAAEYNKLSGFLKGSNLAACDYNEIREKILARDGNPQIVQDDKYVRMEHIRWCRYYYVNHWKYGQPADKKERDRLRIHKCLCPYDELSREDRDKDLETIQVVRHCR